MTRASWLSGAAFVSAMAVTACGQGTNPIEPAGVTGVSGAQGAAPVTIVTPAGQGGPSEVNSGLAEIRQATARFHDVKKAIEAGYLDPAGLPCDTHPAGAGIMGIHAANVALIGDGQVDPLRPDVLLYLPTGNGNFRLIGVEYLQPVLLRNPDTGQVAPWFAAGPWPSTYEVVNPTPSVLGQTFQGPMPGHVPGMPWHWDLHLWIWAPNPAGTFQPWNTGLSCPSGGE